MLPSAASCIAPGGVGRVLDDCRAVAVGKHDDLDRGAGRPADAAQRRLEREPAPHATLTAVDELARLVEDP